jgi:hypothetical protein
MNRSVCRVGLTLVALATGTFAHGRAADPQSLEMVPLKAAGKGPVRKAHIAIVVPVNPPFVSAHISLAGDSELLGAFTYVAQHTATLDARGAPKTGSGIGALAAAGGDAVYISWSALAHPTATGAKAEGPFFITGGSGRFAGATGSGIMIGEIDNTRQELRCTWAGTISRPAATSRPSPAGSKPSAAPGDPDRAREPR